MIAQESLLLLATITSLGCEEYEQAKIKFADKHHVTYPQETNDTLEEGVTEGRRLCVYHHNRLLGASVSHVSSHTDICLCM